MNSSFAKKLRIVFLALGAVILAYLIHKIGIDTILSNIRAVGWWFLPIFCIGIAQPATSTCRRLPYSSYFPSQTSSVFI